MKALEQALRGYTLYLFLALPHWVAAAEQMDSLRPAAFEEEKSPQTLKLPDDSYSRQDKKMEGLSLDSNYNSSNGSWKYSEDPRFQHALGAKPKPKPKPRNPDICMCGPGPRMSEKLQLR